MNLRFFGQMFLFIGALFFVFGFVFYFAGKIPWVGRLPGDFLVKKRNLVFYFPLMTSLLLSLILSILFSLFFKR